MYKISAFTNTYTIGALDWAFCTHSVCTISKDILEEKRILKPFFVHGWTAWPSYLNRKWIIFNCGFFLKVALGIFNQKLKLVVGNQQDLKRYTVVNLTCHGSQPT